MQHRRGVAELLELEERLVAVDRDELRRGSGAAPGEHVDLVERRQRVDRAQARRRGSSAAASAACGRRTSATLPRRPPSRPRTAPTGSDWMPASRMRNISGVHSQTSRSTRPAKARVRLAEDLGRRQADGACQRGDEPDVRGVDQPEDDADDDGRHDHRHDQRAADRADEPHLASRTGARAPARAPSPGPRRRRRTRASSRPSRGTPGRAAPGRSCPARRPQRGARSGRSPCSCARPR